MTPLDAEVVRVAARINERIAEEPEAGGDYFALTDAGRDAVRQILNESYSPNESRKP